MIISILQLPINAFYGYRDSFSSGALGEILVRNILWKMVLFVSTLIFLLELIFYQEI